MKILFSPETQLYLKELAAILYANNYFGTRETSHKYVGKIASDIETRLPSVLHKPAPSNFNKYGRNMRYAVFPRNKHTCWIVFFNIYDIENERIYLVRYINNNHMIGHLL